MNQEVITVTCVVFPDATTFFYEGSEANTNHKLVETFKGTLSPERLRLMHDTGVQGGFVVMRMLREDYIKIGAREPSPYNAVFEGA